MIKKLILAVGSFGVLSVLFFGRDAVSYVWTSAERVKESVRSNVPVEFEIDRARKMVQELVPDIRRNMHVIAQEEVEIEKLQKQIAAAQANVDRQRGELTRLKTDLGEKKATYSYAGRTYSADQVKVDLANRFERCKTSEATFDSFRHIHAARVRSLEAARQKLDGMLVAKRKLEVDVENLEARLKMVEVAQTTSDYNFDDSRLARVKDLMTDIRTRLSVAEKVVSSDTGYQGEIVLEGPAPENILDQVTEYLDADKSGADRVEVEVAKLTK